MHLGRVDQRSDGDWTGELVYGRGEDEVVTLALDTRTSCFAAREFVDEKAHEARLRPMSAWTGGSRRVYE